jgi:16S rRNA processing protein RimM
VGTSDRIQIGVVGKPHGVRGGFFLNGSVDSDALRPGLGLLLGERAFVVVSVGGTEKRPILSLEGLGDRDAVAALRESPVFAARGDLTPLGEGEWFAEDLVGLDVFDGEGGRVGTVSRLVNLPSVDALEVAREGSDDLLLPMLRQAIVSIEPGVSVVVDLAFLNLGEPDQDPDQH